MGSASERAIEISIIEMNKHAFVRGNPHFLFAGKKIKILPLISLITVNLIIASSFGLFCYHNL